MELYVRGLYAEPLFELGFDYNDVHIYLNLIDFSKHPRVIRRKFDGQEAILYNYKHFAKNLRLLNSYYKKSSEAANEKRLKKKMDQFCEGKLLIKHLRKTTKGTQVFFEIDWNKYFELKGIEIPADDQFEEDENPVDTAPTKNETPKAPPLRHRPSTVGANKHRPYTVGAYNDDSLPLDSLPINRENLSNNQEKRPEEKADGQMDLIQSLVITHSCPRDFVIQQIAGLKAERQRRLDKGIEKITNEKRYLAKMLSDKDSLNLFLVENEVKEKKKPTARGFKTQEENALKEKEDGKKKIDRLTEDENRRNDSEFHEMLKQPDCELYKKCFDSLVDYAKQVVVKGENPTLIEISMYSAYKKMTGGFKQTG